MADEQKRVDFLLTATDKASQVFRDTKGAVGELHSSYLLLAGAATAALGAGGVAAFVSDAVRYRAALRDFADTTGDNVRTLDGLSRQARVSGVELDQLQGAIVKFAKNLNNADDDGKAAAEAIRSIGLNVQDLRAKKPAEAMFDIAVALNKFEDGAAKVAIAVALMGKAGAAQLPLLKDLAEAGQLQGKIGEEQSRQAKQLEKDWRALKLAFEDTKQIIVDGMVPALLNLIKNFKEAREAGASFYEAMGAVQRGGDVGMAERILAEAVDRRLQLQNDFDRLRRQSGYTAEQERASITRQIAGLDEKITQARALLKVSEPGFFTPEKEEASKPKLDFDPDADKKRRAAEEEQLKHDMFLEKHRQEAREVEIKDLLDIDKVNQATAEAEIKRQEDYTALLAKGALERTRMREDEAAAAELSAEREYNAKYKYRKIDTESASAFFGILSGMMASHSKRMFEIGKTAAIAQTIIDTYSAAQGAFKAFAGIPIVGPALGAAAAAAAVVAGIARVQAIRATTFGGGGGGGGASPVFSANPNTGQPTAPIGLPQASAGGGTQVTINITGVVTPAVVDQLTDALRDFFGNDGSIIGPNTRQASIITTGA